MFLTFENGMVDLSSPDRITLGGITIEQIGIGESVRQMIVEQTNKILDSHGVHAFASTQAASAIHEAGHVVVGVAFGKRLKRVRICERMSGVWMGLTEYHGRPRLDAPATILKEARFVYAGIAAEMLFDRDFRRGSSLDEFIMSQVLAAIAAHKLGTDGETCWRTEVDEVTMSSLRQHRLVVGEIANRLLMCRTLRGRALDQMVADIKRASR
jgi:hypothetical protein